MYLHSDAEAARQAERTTAQIETVEMKKVCIHMREAAATPFCAAKRQKSFAPCSEKNNNNCCCATFEAEKGSG